MTTGPPFSWPLPTGADVPAIPTHLGNLGGAISDTLASFGLDGTTRLQVGTSVVTPNGAGSAQISFPSPFGGKPVVVAGIGDAGGTALACKVSESASSEAAFTVLLFQENGNPTTSGNYRINWVAVGAVAP